jgi:predicted TIM-barrel fold metal-dependent hydrolase
MRVDGHLHLFRALEPDYPRGVHPLYPPELAAPADELLPVMDEFGIDRAVVVPLDHHDDYLAEVLAQHPDRFVGVGVLDPDDPDPVASTRRRHAEVGLRGLRVMGIGDRMDLLRVLDELDMVLWYYGPPDDLQHLEAALEELPGLKVLLNHMGFCPQGFDVDEHGRPRVPTELPPATLPRVLELSRFAGVRVMVSGQYAFSNEPMPHDDLGEVIRSLTERFGTSRLIWASDWPWIRDEPGYGALLGLVDHFFPHVTPAERDLIRGGNAAELLGL